MATAAKPKKRSRLALPRQKGASTANTSSSGLHGSSQQQTQDSVAIDDGTSTSTNSSPGVSTDSVGLCSTPAASTAGVLSDSGSLQAVPLASVSATGVTPAGDHRPPAAKPTNGGGHREHQQPVPAACKGQGQMQEEKEENQQEGKDVEWGARRVSNGKRSREPLQTLRLNGHPEVAAAEAGRKGLQPATTAVTTSAASAAVAAVAAAASEVSQLLDNLEPKGKKRESRPPSSATASPPAARERAGSGGNQQRLGSASKEAQSDLQYQQSAGHKRPRPVTSTAVPSESNRAVSLRRSESRRALAPPSPPLGRPPPPPPPPVTTTETEGDVVMLDDDQEVEEKSAGGEYRPPGCLSPLEKEEPSPEQRERCPVCSCAVWGLSVRARQVHINSCLDGTAAGASGAVAGGGDRSAGAGVSERGRGGSGAESAGRRSSSGAAAAPVAKVPKTEYQEHIQMAKALSKSLVEPKPTRAAAAAAAAEQDEETEEELARNPAAFRAKEKRLVRALKDLDSKLERLNKDRDAALRKLAAHRALGARASATVSAGAVLSGENDGGDGGGGAAKTAEEVVDIIFPEEHAVTANNRPSTRSEGRRQRLQAAILSAEAVAAGAPAPPETETGPAAADAARAETGSGAAAADAAASTELRPSTSRRSEDPEETVPPAEAGGPGGSPEGPVGVARKVDSAAAHGAPPCGGEECGSEGDYYDGGDDDGNGVGGARLIRRRSGGGGGDGNGNGRLPSSVARKSEKDKSRRTFWGIAQDADELSQSNFVTGVFADIRAAESTATAGGGGGDKRASKVGKATGAAYGDASLYKGRTRPARPASPSAGASAKVTAASTPPPNLGPGLGGTRARGTATAAAVDDGNGSSTSGVDETSTPDGDGGGSEAGDAVDGAILLLSQTLSAGQPRPSSAVLVPPQRPKPSASDMPRSSSTASANKEGGKTGEEVGEGGEEAEAERVAARHIAHAPVEAISGLFPNWKENVRFVFRQGEEELREALRSIDAALSEEEAAVAAGAQASAGREKALGGDSGRTCGEDLSAARGSERHPGCGGGSGGGGGGRAGSGGGKVEALLFFEGVILEALDLKGSAVSSQKGLPPPRRQVEDEDGNHGSGDNNSSSSSIPELHTETPSGRVGDGDDGGEQAEGDSTDGAGRLHDKGSAREEKERDEERNSRRHAGVGGATAGVAVERLPVAGAEAAAGEALDVDLRELLKGGDVSPAVGGAAGGGEAEESRRGDLGGQDSVETIVLSGDSCCDAVVTFDLTSSEQVKSFPRTASPAAAAAAAGVPNGAPSGAGEPPDYGEARENGGSGSPRRGTTSSERNDEEDEDGAAADDDDFVIVGNGGGGKSGSRTNEPSTACDGGKAAGDDGGGGVDEYPAEDEDGFVDDYCPWDDLDGFSVFPSPGDGGASEERFELPSAPLSPTQMPSPHLSPKHGAGDSCDDGAGGDGGGKASRDHGSATDADVLDLTQVSPSPVPSARPCRGHGSESTAAAAVPVRNRPPHRSRETSSARRHHDDAASPPLEMEEEEEEEEVVEQGAPGPIPEIETGVSGNEDGLREVMPSFSQMTLQELAGMMAVYGLKKKSKREMTQRLEHIWKTLHPAAAAAAEAAGEGVSEAGQRGRNASSAVSGSQRRRAAGAGRANAAPTAASARPQGRPPLARPALCTGNSVGGGGGGRGGTSSQRSNLTQQHGEGGGAAVPPRPPSSSQNKRSRVVGSEGEDEATASLGARIRAVITGFAPLHEDILLLRTIELSATQRLLKDKGVKCSKKDLASYLDARGITFVDRGIKRGGEGGRRPPKKKKKQQQTSCARDRSPSDAQG